MSQADWAIHSIRNNKDPVWELQTFTDSRRLLIVPRLLIMEYLKSLLISLIYSENSITEVILHIDTGS